MSLFKKLGKAIGKVAKKAIVGTIARTVVGSVPVLGGVVSAVGAVKSSLHPPTIANTANLSARTGAPAFGHPGIMHTHRATSRRVSRPGKRAPHVARKAHHRRAAGGGTAKQRAARARFAKAARLGRIKKGTHLS